MVRIDIGSIRLAPRGGNNNVARNAFHSVLLDWPKDKLEIVRPNKEYISQHAMNRKLQRLIPRGYF